MNKKISYVDTSNKYQITKLYDNEMESLKWGKEIPVLDFPADWKIQISPPFNGAIVRFRVFSGNAEISVYLDCYNMLAAMDYPYWEIYPHNGDVYRCGLNETDELIKQIQHAIDNYNE